MTITISINITLEAADLVALGSLAWATLPQPPPLPSPAAPPPAPKPQRIEPKPAKRPANVEPTAPNGPESHRTDVRRENAPAEPVAPEIAPILPATEAKDEGKPPKHPRSGDRLPFAEFDMLVGKELKRLSVDGRIPNAGLWDEQRDKRLPTYGAVMQRYGCTNLASFAEKMGMQPPLSKAFTINHNGAAAIHSKSEATA